MANIMSYTDVRNKPSRDGFDLSFVFNGSYKFGEILPAAWKYVLPGDVHDIDIRNFSRTAPVNTASFARGKQYYDWYFIPIEQLWNRQDSVFTQMVNNLQHASGLLFTDNVTLSGELPYVTAQQLASYVNQLANSATLKDYKNNPFGFSRAELTCKLLEYLGYGDYTPYLGKTWAEAPLLNNPKMCILPLLAYQKIYADFFRYTQWEKPNPSTFNLDYITGAGDTEILASYSSAFPKAFVQEMNMFDVRYCNYQKDLYHGVLPVAQYGDAAIAMTSGSLAVVPAGSSSVFDANSRPLFNFQGLSLSASQNASFYHTDNLPVGSGGLTVNDNTQGFASWNDPKLKVVGDATFGLSVLALRQAEFLQKWKEVAVSGEEDYKSQIERHWGVKVSDFLSHSARWLTSVDAGLDISEVTNNNLADNNAAVLAGRGTINCRGHVHFESKGEYGILMCIEHSLPFLDYCLSGVDGTLLAVDTTDFPIPELDRIGMESVPIVKAINPLASEAGISPSTFLGYAPRYIDWKTSVDRTVGAFKRSLKNWVCPMDDAAFLAADSVLFPNSPNVEPDSIGAGFFKVNPAIVNYLFAVAADSSVDTDHIWSNTYFEWHCVRNLDKNGLPY